MADPPLPDRSTDLTNQLLGLGPKSSCLPAAENNRHWKSLHTRIRTTTEGKEAFQRATETLSGKAIVFNNADDTTTNNDDKNPRFIIEAYFRLLRCSLESVDSNITSVMDENEWNQFTKVLLKSLGGSLKSCIQQQIQRFKKENTLNNNSNNNVNSGEQRNETILLYFHSMIDYVMPHVGHNTAILGSTYKIFSELADLFVTLLEMECDTMSHLVKSFLPAVGWSALSTLQSDVDRINTTWERLNDCLKRATICLVDEMDDSLVLVQRVLEGKQEWTSKSDGYSKIMVFRMARAVSLVFLRKRRLQRNNDENGMFGSVANANTCNGADDEGELISRCLVLLIKMRSISVLANGCLEDTHAKAQLDDNRLKLFEMLAGLGQKADVYSAKLLCLDAESKMRDGAITIGLNCLADFPCEELNISLSINRELEGAGPLEDVFPLGKLFVIKHVLSSVCSAASNSLPAQCGTESLIRLCQCTIFKDLPRYYHIFQVRFPHSLDLPFWASKFISDIVGALSSCISTFFVASDGVITREVRLRQHQLLIRWLAVAQNTEGQTTSNHPFSNEIIMCLLQTRILSSDSNQDRKDLLSLMAKLIFHLRTESTHRRLLVTVLARLLRPSNIKSSWESEIHNAKLATITVMWNELSKSTVFSDADRSVQHLGKRRRKASRIPSMAVDACEVNGILSLLAEASVLSQVDLDKKVIQDMRQLWDKILKRNDDRGKLNNRELCSMSLLNGVIRCQANIASIQQMLNNQDVAKSISTSSLVDGILGLVDSLIVSKRIKSGTLRQVYVCVDFIASLVCIPGFEFTESQLTRLGNIFNAINTTKPLASALEVARLHDLLASTSCKLGHVVQPNFCHESLQVRFHLLMMSHFIS